ncbi:exodeoxyribonuclease VII small subunit [Rathayibacter sp. CAU 1779]
MPTDSAGPADTRLGEPRSADPDPNSLSYEQARDELIGVVSRLEQGTPTLEESLALWERGEELARRCEEWLIGAKARLDAARAGVDRGASDDPRGDAA